MGGGGSWQGFFVYSWLCWHLLCKSGWPRTQISIYLCLPRSGLRLLVTNKWTKQWTKDLSESNSLLLMFSHDLPLGSQFQPSILYEFSHMKDSLRLMQFSSRTYLQMCSLSKWLKRSLNIDIILYLPRVARSKVKLINGTNIILCLPWVGKFQSSLSLAPFFNV